MADIVLSYPASSPTETLTLRALRPYNAPIKRFQPKDRSDGMDVYSYDKGAAEQVFTLNLRCTKSQRDSLLDWFDTRANGSVNQLLYADPFGNSHIVRIMDEKLDLREESNDRWTGPLTLKKEG